MDAKNKKLKNVYIKVCEKGTTKKYTTFLQSAIQN